MRSRRAGLFAVMLGALALSFSGQVYAIAPLLGLGLAWVFAVTMDLAAVLALREVVSTTDRSVRRWGWAALLLAGGTALGLNTWHVLDVGTLPVPAAVTVGAGPVVLAGLLSHLFALVSTATATPTVDEVVGIARAHDTAPAPAAPPARPPIVVREMDDVTIRVEREDRERREARAGAPTASGVRERRPVRPITSTAAARPAGRTTAAQYLATARAALTADVEVSPAWVREVTGCSRGLSSELARQLRTDQAGARADRPGRVDTGPAPRPYQPSTPDRPAARVEQRSAA